MVESDVIEKGSVVIGQAYPVLVGQSSHFCLPRKEEIESDDWLIVTSMKWRAVIGQSSRLAMELKVMILGFLGAPKVV